MTDEKDLVPGWMKDLRDYEARQRKESHDTLIVAREVMASANDRSRIDKPSGQFVALAREVLRAAPFASAEALQERAAWDMFVASHAAGSRCPYPPEAEAFANEMLERRRKRFSAPNNEPQTPGSEGNSSEGE